MKIQNIIFLQLLEEQKFINVIIWYASVQVLFPASYADTAAWLRSNAITNQGTLHQCQTRLQEALDSNAEINCLASRVEVRCQIFTGDTNFHILKMIVAGTR